MSLSQKIPITDICYIIVNKTRFKPSEFEEVKIGDIVIESHITYRINSNEFNWTINKKSNKDSNKYITTFDIKNDMYSHLPINFKIYYGNDIRYNTFFINDISNNYLLYSNDPSNNVIITIKCIYHHTYNQDST